MKILTGTISDGKIILDKKPRLPDKTRVQLVIQAIGCKFDDLKTVEISEEETELVDAVREDVGKLTQEECG